MTQAHPSKYLESIIFGVSGPQHPRRRRPVGDRGPHPLDLSVELRPEEYRD